VAAQAALRSTNIAAAKSSSAVPTDLNTVRSAADRRPPAAGFTPHQVDQANQANQANQSVVGFDHSRGLKNARRPVSP
jgi:hypothetical protein